MLDLLWLTAYCIMSPRFVLILQEYFCCVYGWSYRLLHVAVGAVLLGVMGMVVGLCEPQLLGFVVDRLPVDNPITQQLLLATRGGNIHRSSKKKKKI